MESLKDGSHLYEVARRTRYVERAGFRATEFHLTATQRIPWHRHSNVQDTFYVVEGRLRLFVRDPKEEIVLEPGQSFTVRPERPHLVTNGGDRTLVFVLLQGIGEYDYVPLT